MKEYIILFFSAITGLLGFTACDNALDAEPYDRINEDVVWSSKANAETFIYGTYGIMSSYASGAGSDLWTSNIIASYGTAGDAYPIYTETLTNRSDYGFNNWKEIRRCNLIIEKVGQSTGISDADKNALIAEGKFLRAMSNYSIARKTGRIVWIDKVLTPEDELKLSSTVNPTESYNYIIKDLEDAVADLPTTKIAGRANKYVAAAFLTEVYLQSLAYRNYPAAANVSAADPVLDKIIAMAQIVIDGGYAMETDYEGMFNQTKNTSNEIIFAIYNKAINTTIQSTPMQTAIPNITNDKIKKFQGTPLFSKPVPFECWPENFPAQNLTDDYLVIDKANPSKAVRWYETSQYLNAIDETVDVRISYQREGFPFDKVPATPDESLVLQGRIKPGSLETVWTLTNENRDARWKASIISDSCSFYNEMITTCVRGNANRWMDAYKGGDWGFGYTNMYWRKGIYSNVSPSFLNSVTTDYHYVCNRLGRVYLNLAEAYLLKGDVVNAVTFLNKTRVVHGQLPPSSAQTLADAWTDYKRERRVELTMENDRYFSLLRWGRFGGVANEGLAPGGTLAELTEPMRVMDVSKDRKSFAVVSGSFGNAYNQRLFEPGRRYLFPIAQGYIDNNENFGPQNPGW